MFFQFVYYLFHNIDFILKLSKMLSKKKPGLPSSKNQQSNSKLSSDNKHSVRKSYQKHSRKGTKDYDAIDFQVLINHRLYSSARQIINNNLKQNINSIVFGYSTPFSLQLKEALAISNTNQQLNSYHILSKHRNQYLEGKITIQTALVQTIQGKNYLQFIAKPIMHFEVGIYTIMNRHMIKRKQYLKKITAFQTQSSVQRQPKPWTKELPTLVSDRDHEDSEIFDKERCSNSDEKKCLNTSESFELKRLAQCIKDMFNKQIFDNQKESIMIWPGGQNSWLIQGKSLQKKPLLQCDFSSIQSNSKYDLQVDSKVKDIWTNEVEENYGLGSLRRKYEQQKLSKLKQSSEINGKVSLGHKRNPTQTLHTKDHLLEEPMTPKEGCKSVFTSSQNIVLNSPKHKKSKSKKKEFEVNEAYLLRFQKRKQPSVMTNLKENINKQKSKTKSQVSKSRSKQKLRLAAKKK